MKSLPLLGKSLLSITAVIAITAASSIAQAPANGHFQPTDFPRGGMGMGGPHGFGGEFGLMEFGRPVTGAPYSATITHTHQQTLANGTTISTTETQTVSRDSEGRVRIETTTKPHFGRGAAAGSAAGTPHTRVTVFDPVAHTITTWGNRDKVAVVEHLRGPRGPKDGAHWQGKQGGAAPDANAQAGSTPGGPRPHGQWGQRGKAGTQNPDMARTDLGSKNIDGLTSTGELITHTIPAGAMGNSQPLVSTHERWFSPDLKIVLAETNNDPIRGTSTLQVANLNRNEPTADLFKAPADYTVRQMRGPGGPGEHFHGAPQPPAPSQN